jgi:hypothetical protein
LKDLISEHNKLSETLQEKVETYGTIGDMENEINNLPDPDSTIREAIGADDDVIDRRRAPHTTKSADNKDESIHFYNMGQDEYESTINESKTHLKSKNGVRVTEGIHVSQISADTLIAIKKISNIVTSILLPLAQKLYDSRFSGITLQDKNTTIPQLYKDMDDKMYILTSLNNQKVTSLIKLDKDFDKLYNIVSNGLNMYVMPTGGSMMKGGHIRTTTDYLYEL